MKTRLYTLIIVMFVSCSSEEERLNKFLYDISTQTEFNGLVYVENNNQVLYNGNILSYSVSSKPLEYDSKVYLASLTKLFTEITILALIEEGKLTLDNTIDQYRPNFQPAYGSIISIANLLNMSTGLPRELDSENLMNSLKFDEYGFAGPFLDSTPNIELAFRPGAKFEYSNLNYWLLGAIIEKVTGLNLDQAFSKYIFNPLEMKNSGYSLKNPSLVIGYKKANDKWIADQTNYIGRYASGGAYSSLQDLIKLSDALKADQFLNEKSLDYLFGENQSIEVYGSLPGFTNMIYIEREENTTIIVLNNIGVPDLRKVSELKLGVLKILGVDTQKNTQSAKHKITLINVSNLSDSIPIEKGMKNWIEAILNSDKDKMNDVFNDNATTNGKMDITDPTWDELIRLKNEWPNFRVYGYRWIEKENPKGIEVWFYCDGEQRIALQWIIENEGGKTVALFVKPDNMTWLGQEFQ
ncbi:serine hydrolase domain-containing protein [uncultured Winogradskyella sp.]|uniref:serine hydrolase domain-containing protein n=1 Tax=uncultured Winogradskyella sp. TaxID=395353 RepID=UPI00262D124B|nr:serine hydrolase domain-containing protein [uncultured Winogradskyella sp.]